jgi:hypothetical protein
MVWSGVDVDVVVNQVVVVCMNVCIDAMRYVPVPQNTHHHDAAHDNRIKGSSTSTSTSTSLTDTVSQEMT